MQDIREELDREGYAIVRGFFGAADMQRISEETDRTYAEGLKHHATFRDRNLLFEVLNDPRAAAPGGAAGALDVLDQSLP